MGCNERFFCVNIEFWHVGLVNEVVLQLYDAQKSSFCSYVRLGDEANE